MYKGQSVSWNLLFQEKKNCCKENDVKITIDCIIVDFEKEKKKFFFGGV